VGEWREGKRNGVGSRTYHNGDRYTGGWKDGKRHGDGTYSAAIGIYEGTWKDDLIQGKGTFTFANGEKYTGSWSDGQLLHSEGIVYVNGDRFFGEKKNGKPNGQGVLLHRGGAKIVGLFKDGELVGPGIKYSSDGSRISSGLFAGAYYIVREYYVDLNIFDKITHLAEFPVEKKKANLPNLSSSVATSTDVNDMPLERQQTTEEHSLLEKETQRHEQAKASSRIDLKVSVTNPSADGEYTISIDTNTDTASLKINGEELGGTADGRYKVNRVARAGQDTTLDIIAKDVYGNTDAKSITVNRAITESRVVYASLNPAQVRRQAERDAVAIIIGISNYKTLPKADFANDDARVFYDYAIRALGVKPENIKILVDADAEDVEIIKAFKTWLPSRVKSTTDVYVFYSGHGLPTQDGQGLYLLPPRADRDFISRTAIQFQEINSDLQAAKPKSVTIFMDACYSGQARSGETLVANARPVTLKAERKLFPDNFTVITASQADQISSSSPDLKHGIFSYYLMKGMEGEADTNKDGKITLGEMQAYLVENVGRQAGMMSRKQEPQLIGDTGRVLVGR